ncbi:MAG: chemotaxis protein CheB [Bdellovibrionales bacterium]
MRFTGSWRPLLLRMVPERLVIAIFADAQSQNSSIPVVGIGASAGGLETLRVLLESLKTDTGMAFVIIQHLKRDQGSRLGDILSRCTEMPVKTIENGLPVEPNVVFVAPPGVDVVLSGDFLNLSTRGESPVHHLGIDFFFVSLSQNRKSKAIGVILSGTGSDGTLGFKAIKSEGGITIAQDPKTAKFDGMPRSAIAAGIADLILAPEDIAHELDRLAKHPYTTAALQPHLYEESDDFKRASPQIDENSVIGRILDLLLDHTKIDFSQYKLSTIRRRIERQMMLRKIETIERYAEYLCKNNDEVKSLYEDIFIHVTDFFRDPEAFQALEENVFAALVKNRNPDHPIRIWIPGCATGEEVYSLAIALSEYLETHALNLQLNIFAGDISEPALLKARKGVYADYQMRSVSPKRLELFFEKVKGGYKIKKGIRDICIFSRHDVTSNPPIPKVDLISCRNVLIYFSADLQKRVFPVFHYALNPSGYLWLGKAENPDSASRLFSAVDKKHKIFTKVQSTVPVQPRFSTSIYSPSQVDANVRANDYFLKAADSVRSADQVILYRYSPPSVVVDSSFDVLQFRGRTIPFIEPAPGVASHNLLKMANPEILPHLRVCLQNAKKHGGQIRKEDISFDFEGQTRRVTIDVSPLNPLAPPKDRQFLVIFEDLTSTRTVKRKLASAPKRERAKVKELGHLQTLAQYNTQLLQELEATREYQQSLVEEYEAAQEELTSANEELRSTNEELQSTNEELHSTNEELGTAKEELQAANEELLSTNDEIQRRNQELENALRDLEQSEQRFRMLIENVKDYAIFMLDPEGHVSTWNEGAKRLKGYDAKEIMGQHFSRFFAEEDRDWKPKHELEEAARTGRAVDEGWRVRKDGSRFWANVAVTAIRDRDDRLIGFGKVTRDLTERKLAEQARLEEQARAAAHKLEVQNQRILAEIFDKAPSFMTLTRGPNHVFELANQEYFRVLRLDRSVIGKTVRDVFPEMEEQGLIDHLDQAYRTGVPFQAEEAPLRLRTPNGGERLIYVDFVYQPVRDVDGKIYGLVHQGYEVTEKVLARRAVENERENFRNLFKQTPEMVCILRGPDHLFEFVNEAHIRALGFDATGMTVREAQPESVEVHDILDEVYRTGKTAALHEIPVTVTDRLRYFNLTYSARRDDAGKINGVMILGMEVTDQVSDRQRIREYASELEKSQRVVLDERERFDRIAAATNLGVWFCDLPFADLEWNSNTKDHFWLPADAQVTIETFYDRIHPDDRERTRQAIDHSIQTHSPYDVEYRTTPANSRTPFKWIRAIGWADYDSSGKPIRFDGITLDVSEHKRAIEEQKRSLEVLETINRVGQFISAELELSHLVQSVTDAATRLAGAEFGAFFYNVLNNKGESYTLYALSGAPREAFEKFPMPRNTEVFGPTFHGTGVVRSDDISKDPRYGKNAPYYGMPQGHLPVVSYLAVPVVSRSGEVLGGLFFGHSRAGVFSGREEEIIKGLASQAAIAIDNARLFQQLKEAVHARDQFMSIASHELRTPLTSMKLQTQLFHRSQAKNPGVALEPQKMARFVGSIDGGLNRLIRLVDDMLDISRIQHGRLSINAERMDLVPVLSEALERLKPQLAEAGMELKVSAPRQLFANIDRFRIEQVITNLVTNAIRYAANAPLDVTLQAVEDRITVSFKDYGPGIKKEDRVRVFDRFERLVSADQISGMGLGLFISREIVEAHGGTIKIDSEEHQGACFVIDLPGL